MADAKDLAREAAGTIHGENSVGDFLTTIAEEDPGVFTHLFSSKLRGYPDWTFAVTTFTDDGSGETTVSEVNLLPSDTSLLAPKWVPWAERLADYKALQAALEEQAKAEAEEAAANEVKSVEESGDESGEDEDDDIMDVDEEDEDSDESASGLSDEAESAESDSDDAGAEPKSFFRYKFIRRHKKRK